MPKEGLEGIRFETQTVTLQEFKKLIAPHGERDPRFISGGNQHVFEFLEEDDLRVSGGDRDPWVSYLSMNGLIVGVVILRSYTTHPHALLTSVITVDKNLIGLRRSDVPENRELKLSLRLLREVFRFAKKNNKSLEVSAFTDAGLQRLYPQFLALSKKTGVPVSLPHDNP